MHRLTNLLLIHQFSHASTAVITAAAGSDVCSLAGETITCKSVVITTGTFLRGIIHVGSKTRAAGRMPSLDSQVSLPGCSTLRKSMTVCTESVASQAQDPSMSTSLTAM